MMCHFEQIEGFVILSNAKDLTPGPRCFAAAQHDKGVLGSRSTYKGYS